MKSKLLVEFIQKLDPSGELEVCIPNAAIHHLEKLPASDEDNEDDLMFIEESNISKSKFHITKKGQKIVIKVLDIEDFIITNTGDIDNFVFDNNDHKGEYNDYLEHCSEEVLENLHRFINDTSIEIIRKLQDGYKIVETSNPDNAFLELHFVKNNKAEELDAREIKAIVCSDLFDVFPLDSGDKIWKLK